MSRYNIRIDGEVMPNSYTYEELLMNDILDFDDIEVKQVSKSKWTNIKSFYFPEEHENEASSDQNYYIGEDGQVHFHNQKENKNSRTQQYVIDEFGQVVSQNNIGGGSHLTSRPQTSTTSSNTNSSSSSDNTGWKVLLTIAAIIIFIVITCTTGWGSIPAGALGCVALRSIWSDEW